MFDGEAMGRRIRRKRQEQGLTQAQFAKKIGVSTSFYGHIERGSRTPSIDTLVIIANALNVGLDALLRDDTPKPVDDAQSARQLNARRRMILLMSVSLCWLVATIAYFALKLAVPTLPRVWLAFIYALPASFIVCTVFTCIWWKKLWRLLSISGIIWTLAVAVHISIRLPAIYLIYVVAAVVQALFLMFFHFLRIK